MADAQLRLEDDVKISQLVSEHHDLDKRIRHFSELAYLTHQQQYEEALLKKRKLALKDRIEAVRRQASPQAS